MNLKLKNKWTSLLTIVSMLAMVTSWVVLPAQAASPPNIVTYQGRVLDANAVPVSSSSISMKFFLYSSLAGGTCIWSNSSSTCDGNTPGSTTARTVTLTSGLFTENLGDTAAATPYAAIADSTFADNSGIYLEVIIAGETLTPRKQLVSAPYAQNADTLDGIDLSVIQLWEVGTNGSYEDDATVIVGADAVFSYGTGGVGDLRVADEIEVMGDGFIDNDLVVGASTSSTETITNVAFSLSGNDLFVASDAGIEGNLYIDGAIDLVGTATVGDLACTDCLDFAELSDTLALDVSTSITQDGAEVFTITNSGTGDTVFNLSSTGDFIIQDNGTPALTVNDSGNAIFAGDLAVNGGDLTSTATTWNIDVGNTGSFVFRDGTNTLFSIADAGTTGNASITGTLGVTGAVTLTNDLAVNGDDITSDGNLTLSATGYTRVGDTGVPGDATADDALYVEGAFEVDGTAYFGGTVNASDFSCTDCLDFAELSDTLALDASTSVTQDGAEVFTITNSGTGDTVVNLSSTGDFIIQDNGTPSLTVNDSGNAILAGDLAVNGGDLTSTATTFNFDVGNTGTFLLRDGTNNLLTIADAGTTGNVTATGTLTSTGTFAVTSGDFNVGIIDGSTGNIDGDGSPTADILQIGSGDTSTTDGVDALQLTFTASNASGNVVDITPSVTNGGAGVAEIYNIIDVDAFTATSNVNALNTLALTGINFGTLTQTETLGTITATAVNVGAGWDTALSIGDNTTEIALTSTTPTITIGNTGTLTITDGTNTLFSIADAGTTGNASITGTLGVTGAVTLTNDLAVNGDDITSDGNLTLSATGYTRVGDTGTPGDATADDALYVEGAFEVDGTAYFGGTVNASDFSCTDCLDFAEFADSLSLDTNTTITQDAAEIFTISNTGTGATAIDLTSTGDLDIRDSSTPFFTFNDDRSIDYSTNQTTTDAFDFTADSVSTANALDFSVDALTTGRGIYLTTTSGVATSADLMNASITGTHAINAHVVSGSVIDASRSLTVNDSTGAVIDLSVTGPVVSITDNCLTPGNDTCTHTGPVFQVQQDYASATGPMIQVYSAGAGAAIAIGGSGTGTAILIDSTTYVTDINLQNGETISNNTDGSINFGVSSSNELSLTTTALSPGSDSGLDLGTSLVQFADLYLDGGNVTLDNATDIDIDDNTASVFTITEGATNYLNITTSNTLETMTIGSATLTRLTITTADSGVTDVSVTGSMAVSNDLTVTDDTGLNGDLNVTLDDGDTISMIGDGSATTTILNVAQASSTADADALAIDLTQADGTAAGADNVGIDMVMIGNDADGDMLGIRITSTATTNAGAGTYESALSITNTENTAGSMTDAIVIVSSGIDAGITDAVDVSNSNITNAINAGANFYNMDGIRFFEGATGTVTFEDTSGNDLMTLSDSSNAGIVDLTGALIARSGAPFTDYSGIAASGSILASQSASTALAANRNDMGGYFSVTADANPGAFTHGVYGVEGVVTYTRSSGDVANAIYGVSGVANHSSSALTIGTSAGILGRTGSNTAGGTITNAIGVDGSVTTGDGAITNGYGGRFANTADGTSRFGIYAEASGGTNNFAGYFSGSQVHVATDSTPASPTLATGAGDLYVESDLETDGNVRVDGGDFLSSASTFNFLDAASNSLTIDIGGVTTDLANIIGIATNGTSADTISIGNTNALTTLALNGGNDWTMSTGGVLTINPAAVGTYVDFGLGAAWTSGDLINADFGAATTQTGRMMGIDLDFTGLTPDGANAINGIHVDDPDSNLGGTQNGIYVQGTNWDYGLYIEDVVAIGLGSTTSTNAVCSSLGNGITPTGGAAYNILDCDGAPAADYAEQYPVASGISYGDIVVPGIQKITTQDGQTIVQLVKSSNPYQGPVSGIVSNNYGDFTSAGYNVNDSDNPMPVALVGRVPVNVTNENGSIQVGDYLTTSSTPGFAMKATEVGRVIGMSLADFSGTNGQVMVQVNNGWYLGNVIGSDGSSTVVTDKAVMAPLGTASESQPSFDSYGFALRGSAWNGNEAQAVEMMLKASVTDQNNYRLSVRNTTDTEVAYITDKGTLQIAGDMVITGRLYPSDRGVAQTDKYIYYDGSEGAGGDFMRTNAKGWSTGSYDFAEMFPSNEILQPGEIVVLSGEGEKVRRSVEKNESGIVGIVSTRPGFLAGENSPGSYPIALSGRVPTFVTTENGEIKVGDPLVSSSKSGYAMKATEAGVIVGYALEPIATGEGSILSYVNVGYWGGVKTSSAPGTNNSASEIVVNSNINSTALNMSGNIYMTGNDILSIGRLVGISDVWEIMRDGTIKTEALLKTVIHSYTDEKVETIAVTSPEAIITLSGTSKLSGGTAEVRFESVSPEFNDVTSADAPIRVLVTPNGPVSLYVSEKDNNHFVVNAFGSGTTDVFFDWMVTAYRKGYEPEEQKSEIGSQISEENGKEVLPVIPSEAEESPSSSVTAEAEDSPSSVIPSEAEGSLEEVVRVDPASPASPDETIVDQAVEVEGGEQAEVPTETLIENPSSTQGGEQF